VNQHTVRHGMANNIKATSYGAASVVVDLTSNSEVPRSGPLSRICASDTSIMVASALRFVRIGMRFAPVASVSKLNEISAPVPLPAGLTATT